MVCDPLFRQQRSTDWIFLPFELLFGFFEAIGRVVRKRKMGFADERFVQKTFSKARWR
jgi:hypothetical protein